MTSINLSSNDELIESVRIYIKHQYSNDISLEHLACKAGMTPSYFSRNFKKIVGMSPITYLNEVRMKRAQDLLHNGDLLIREIAQQVGYQDDLYFSRKFKSFYGVSPSNYAKKLKRINSYNNDTVLSISPNIRIAVTLQRLADPLIALGIEPAAIACFGCSLKDSYIYEQIPFVFDLGGYPVQKEALLKAGPELIIADQWCSGKQYRMYAKIAPTVIISGEDWRDYFPKIAQLFGKEEQAQKLLTEYQRYTSIARSKISGFIHKETVLLLRIFGEELRVPHVSPYGPCGVIYKDLGLLGHPFLYKNKDYDVFSLSEITSINPDRLFIEIVPWHKGSNTFFQETVLRSKEWQSLKAVKNEKAHFVDNGLWVEGDGIIGRKLMVEDVVNKICSTS